MSVAAMLLMVVSLANAQEKDKMDHSKMDMEGMQMERFLSHGFGRKRSLLAVFDRRNTKFILWIQNALLW